MGRFFENYLVNFCKGDELSQTTENRRLTAGQTSKKIACDMK